MHVPRNAGAIDFCAGYPREGLRVFCARSSHQRAIGKKGVWPVCVVEVLVLDLIALATCRVVKDGVERPAQHVTRIPTGMRTHKCNAVMNASIWNDTWHFAISLVCTVSGPPSLFSLEMLHTDLLKLLVG